MSVQQAKIRSVWQRVLTMPNLYSKLTNYVIAGYAYKDRRRTSQQIVDSIKQEWPTQNAPETIPSVIAKDPSITTSETTFTSTLGRKWQTFTLRPIQDESDKVMVFYHGGGWIMGVRLVVCSLD